MYKTLDLVGTLLCHIGFMKTCEQSVHVRGL